MLLAVALVLVLLWMLAVVVFKVTAFFIHIALFVAALALLGHFARRHAPRP